MTNIWKPSTLLYAEEKTMPIKYIELFNELLECQTEEEAFFKLRKLQISESSYSFKLECFKNVSKLNDSEIAYLSGLYKNYVKYFQLNKPKKEKDLQIYLEIVNDIIKSGYSMHEYCSRYGRFTMRELKKIVSHISIDYPDIHQEIIDKCAEPNPEFYTYMREVMDIILSNNSFDLFDYYCYTKISPRDFLELCKNILDEKSYHAITPFIRKFDNIIKIPVCMQSELNGITCIKGKEISKEQKIKIAEYLDEHYIPCEAFKFAVRKYAAEDERLTTYVNQQQKIKIER